METTTTDQWARLRAALDGWDPPVGMALHYAIDERAGRFAYNVTLDCGGGVYDTFRIDSVGFMERVIGIIRHVLDVSAHDLLRDHVCCCGRLPRAIRRAGRHFEAWADDYAFLHRYEGRGEASQC